MGGVVGIELWDYIKLLCICKEDVRDGLSEERGITCRMSCSIRN